MECRQLSDCRDTHPDMFGRLDQMAFCVWDVEILMEMPLHTGPSSKCVIFLMAYCLEDNSALQWRTANAKVATEISPYVYTSLYTALSLCARVWTRVDFACVSLQDPLLCQQCSPHSRCLWVKQLQFYLFSPHSSALQHVQLFPLKLNIFAKTRFEKYRRNAMQKET